MIRKGETNSFVELCMYEPESEKSEEGNIIISREISATGKKYVQNKWKNGNSKRTKRIYE